ncbi:MAG TPA: polysaccharide biosynthesis C-terminal domain-containing protein [Dermatophilaceae bacterium]|nr:polysaccharide biosynthesis C-terminal domain-containing protein [Dermatophilaceae bacterium]
MTAGVTGMQGLTALLTAKWLGAADRGVLVVAQTIAMVLLLIGGLGLIAGTRVLLADEQRGITLTAYVQSTRLLVVLELLLVGSVGVVAFRQLAEVDSVALVAGLIVMAVFGYRAALLREALHGVGHHRSAVGSELMAAGFPLLGMTVAHMMGLLTVSVAMVMLAAGAMTQWTLQWLRVRRIRKPTPAPSLAVRWGLLTLMVRFSLPGLVAALGLAVAGRVDRLILAFFHGPTSVGVYATASTLADLPWILPAAVSAVIVRGVAQSGSTANHGLWWRRVVAATTGITLLTFGAGWWLLERFLGGAFAGSSLLLAVLLLGSFAIASQQVDLAVCSGRGDLVSSARAAGVGLIVGLLSYLVLIPPYAALGAAIGTVVTYTAMAIAARRLVGRHLRQES